MLNTILAQNPLSNPWQSPPLNIRELVMFQMIAEMVAGEKGYEIREIAGSRMVLISVPAFRFTVRQIGTEIE